MWLFLGLRFVGGAGSRWGVLVSKGLRERERNLVGFPKRRQKRLEDGVEAGIVTSAGIKGRGRGCFVVIDALFYFLLGPSRSLTSKIIRVRPPSAVLVPQDIRHEEMSCSECFHYENRVYCTWYSTMIRSYFAHVIDLVTNYFMA